MTRPSIEMQIEEIVVTGVTPGSDRAMRDAIAKELARLLPGEESPELSDAVGRAIAAAIAGRIEE